MIRRVGAVSGLLSVALVVLGFGAVPRVTACTYGSQPGDAAVDGDLVFTGTAIARSDTAPSGFRSAERYSWWTFAIDSVRHGRPTVRESVQTADDGAACGAPLELGHRFLVGVDTDNWMVTGADIHELPALAEPPPVESIDLNTLVPVLTVALVVIAIGTYAFLRSPARAERHR